MPFFPAVVTIHIVIVTRFCSVSGLGGGYNPTVVFVFPVVRCRCRVAIPCYFLAFFSSEKSPLLVPSEVSVTLASIVSAPVIVRGVVSLIPVPAIVISVFVVAVIVIASSISISVAAFTLVAVVSPGSIFFRVLINARFYVSDRCCLPIKQVVLAAVLCMCPRVADHTLCA